MHRTTLAIVAVILGGVGTPTAWGVVFDHAAHYVKRGYHRNEAWPYPFICPDREAVRQPFAIMVNNGWRKQNLLGPQHFNVDGTGLSMSGELKVRWITTQAPAEYRSIYVERAVDPNVTAERIAAARAYAAMVAIDDQPPQVSETNIYYEGRPAEDVNAINVRFRESAPPPVLPPAVSTGTGN